MEFQTEVRRVVKCSPERAYQLWTDPALLGRWFCPKDIPSEIEIDPRPGGKFRFVVHYKPDDYFACTCEIRAMEPAKRYAFSWKWDESSFETGTSEVEVLFDALPGGGTAVTLRHTKLQSDLSMDRHSEGWGEVLERFEEAINNPIEEKV